MLPRNLIIMGDFNTTLLTVLNQLKQYVNGTSHINGNMLDLVISREDEDFVRNVTVTDMISDHAIVDIKLAIYKPRLPNKKVTHR